MKYYIKSQIFLHPPYPPYDQSVPRAQDMEQEVKEIPGYYTAFVCLACDIKTGTVKFNMPLLVFTSKNNVFAVKGKEASVF